MLSSHKGRDAGWAVATLALLLAWDASGLDLAVARLAGGAGGFPLREHWLLAGVLHDGIRPLPWALLLLLCGAVLWPAGPLARLGLARRLQLPLTALAATALVAALKGFSGTSCPWDLTDFGGAALRLSHWRGWLVGDGGGGGCFPAGHASSGFAFVGGYFALRPQMPALARRWLAAALAFGVVLGAVQQLRGAHFMSHTLWAAWVCWMVAWLSDPLFARNIRETAAAVA